MGHRFQVLIVIPVYRPTSCFKLLLVVTTCATSCARSDFYGFVITCIGSLSPCSNLFLVCFCSFRLVTTCLSLFSLIPSLICSRSFWLVWHLVGLLKLALTWNCSPTSSNSSQKLPGPQIRSTYITGNNVSDVCQWLTGIATMELEVYKRPAHDSLPPSQHLCIIFTAAETRN